MLVCRGVLRLIILSYPDCQGTITHIYMKSFRGNHDSHYVSYYVLHASKQRNKSSYKKETASKHIHSIIIQDLGSTYCWWTKSCTSWYGKYPFIYRVLYIPGGCSGFLPQFNARITSVDARKLPRLGLYGLTLEVLVVDYFWMGLNRKDNKVFVHPHLPVRYIFGTRVDRYLILWQLEACFQIYRELEDQGQV